MSAACGALIAESLVKGPSDRGFRPIGPQDCPGGRGRRDRWSTPHMDDIIEFDVDDWAVDQLAAPLTQALDPTIGWYCDYRTSDETFVVFAGRVFRYPRGKPTAERRPRRP